MHSGSIKNSVKLRKFKNALTREGEDEHTLSSEACAVSRPLLFTLRTHHAATQELQSRRTTQLTGKASPQVPGQTTGVAAIPSRKVSAASAPAAPAASAAVLPPEERAGQSVSEGGAPGSCLQASLAGVGAAEVPTWLGSPVDPRKVLIVAGHHNWIVVTYAHFVVCYRIKESSGWQQVFSSPYLDWAIERVALNAKVVGGPHGDKDKMVAVASESSIILWSIQDGGSGSEIGNLQLHPHDTIPETATYGAVRPYRESPLLARARRTESPNSYKDFQSFNLGINLLEREGAEHGSLSLMPSLEVRRTTAETSALAKKSSAVEVWTNRGSDGVPESTKPSPESPGESKKKGQDEEMDLKQEIKKRSTFDGGFLGRKKASPVPPLASPPSGAEGGSESSGTASPSPTKMATSPRHKKNNSSCQEYSL
ncbi:UNVERIFIED_CONTAM: hypothetical protein FKN15_055988 [Acipenser sinensis]